ncbi:MAG: hypothetical protein JWO54_286 [Candidatus Saccharibacteria bacterium]|nr:hypothetical protein [Candidatus Saccharibacteria bacterium]MDB5180528.1 hypothetical protein [Candidatus Saccharibacteria bacterium]
MKLRIKNLSYFFAIALVVSSSIAIYSVDSAQAVACTAPGSDYGTVTQTSTVSTAGTYRIWARMAALNTTDDSFLLEIDGNTCYIVGGSNVPTYTSGATTHFANNTTGWISTTSTGTPIDVSLTAASHTFKLIGSSQGVVVDRLILTGDTGCTPKGVGDNCITIYLAADIDQNSNVNFLDFSQLASKYNQSGASLGRADINLDGTVNFLDYSLLANKYGQ